MTREFFSLREHSVEEKIKESPGKIISHDIQGSEIYQERSLQFKKKLAKALNPSMLPEQIVDRVVETALHTEFSAEIVKYPIYDDMKETIVAALLKDKELKESILHIADKYKRPEHTH